ncbi:hypothetical protein LTR10_002372 [Elasticomyces elasticus]|nr:hypothetical protein LTR10_002372 [Elasticomyces elasticus]KAK4973560.1 hypothetical protein LTR42_005549 [Elasticomyces elasticus]
MSGYIRPPDRQFGLEQTMTNLYLSEQYSDLTIKCGEKLWWVHQAIVCPQSPFFAEACASNPEKAKNGTLKLRDDPAVVEAMFKFLYTGNYSDEPLYEDYQDTTSMPENIFSINDNSTRSSIDEFDDGYDETETAAERLISDRDTIAPIVLNVHLYALAEKYSIPAMAHLAAAKFEERTRSEWDTVGFANATAVVYTIVTDCYQELRDIIASVAILHIHELSQGTTSRAFRELVSSIPALGSGMWQAVAGTIPQYRVEYKYCRCPGGCGWVLPSENFPVGRGRIAYCMGCSAAFHTGQWLAERVDRNGVTEEEMSQDLFRYVQCRRYKGDDCTVGCGA